MAGRSSLQGFVIDPRRLFLRVAVSIAADFAREHDEAQLRCLPQLIGNRTGNSFLSKRSTLQEYSCLETEAKFSRANATMPKLARRIGVPRRGSPCHDHTGQCLKRTSLHMPRPTFAIRKNRKSRRMSLHISITPPGDQHFNERKESKLLKWFEPTTFPEIYLTWSDEQRRRLFALEDDGLWASMN